VIKYSKILKENGKYLSFFFWKINSGEIQSRSHYTYYIQYYVINYNIFISHLHRTFQKMDRYLLYSPLLYTVILLSLYLSLHSLFRQVLTFFHFFF
jgi:hypothetical protein